MNMSTHCVQNIACVAKTADKKAMRYFKLYFANIMYFK